MVAVVPPLTKTLVQFGVCVKKFKNGRTDALCGCLGLAVAGVGIAQGHGCMAVAKKAFDDRQRCPLHNGVTGKRMAKVMETDIVQTGLFADGVPERKFVAQWP